MRIPKRIYMNEKVLKTLEYNKILTMLAEHASSDMGKARIFALLPHTDMDLINKAQTNTSDALSRIYKSGSLSFTGLTDPKEAVKRLDIGSVLGIHDLLLISRLLNICSNAKSYDNKEIEDSLSSLFDGLEPLPDLNKVIKRCILSEDEISDDASVNLRDIRRKIKVTNDRIHTELNQMISSQAGRGYLQDAIITMRNGRYCVPVKSEHRSDVPGMIHDQSQSGSTVFIEPMAVVKLNNQLRELASDEADEIQKILSRLSELAAEQSPFLINNADLLTELDFIFAKASFAKSLKASKPVFNNEGIIEIKKGRHPLIESNLVVPIDIHLGDDFSMLIVTGPNTGGKTVSIKTVGLFCLMGQAGLHIPADENSRLSVFNEVFADIGDEQSIEMNLSTFSSHMTNIVNILGKADENSLVLFDELCSGTDPTEGAALAISILSYLKAIGAKVMATTHYSELKLFALQTNDVENACCEFDLESLRPTYRLLIGVPGKSNAFAISKKLGLSDYIIEEAKKKLDSDDLAFEDLLNDLEKSRIALENEKAELEKYKEEAKVLKEKLHAQNENIDERKEKIIRKASEEAREILEEAKELADETIKNINKYGKASNSAAAEKERSRLREQLKKTNSNLGLKKDNKKGGHNTKDFHLGDSVKVLSMNLTGTVNSLPDAKGYLMVQMGILKSKVHYSDLLIIDEPSINDKNLNKTGAGKIKMSKSMSVKSEINLLGMTGDEAVSALDKYLDDAIMAHLSSVRIVHGKGTGALRNAVHAYLKKQKNLSYRLGNFGEGDAGVTIVEFK